MNKEIASSFENKLNKISEIHRSIIEELRARLMEMGEQSFLYDDDEPVVPIYYLTDENDEGLTNVDKINVNKEGVIIIHDKDFDIWNNILMLDNSAIYTLLGYIDWK